MGVPDKTLRVHMILEGDYDLHGGKITQDSVDAFIKLLEEVLKKNLKSKMKVGKLSMSEIAMDGRDSDKVELYFDVVITSINDKDFDKKQEWWEDRIDVSDEKKE